MLDLKKTVQAKEFFIVDRVKLLRAGEQTRRMAKYPCRPSRTNPTLNGLSPKEAFYFRLT
jgi:hypothetical protein